jgi:hypothetical protein
LNAGGAKNPGGPKNAGGEKNAGGPKKAGGLKNDGLVGKQPWQLQHTSESTSSYAGQAQGVHGSGLQSGAFQ